MATDDSLKRTGILLASTAPMCADDVREILLRLSGKMDNMDNLIEEVAMALSYNDSYPSGSVPWGECHDFEKDMYRNHANAAVDVIFGRRDQ